MKIKKRQLYSYLVANNLLLIANTILFFTNPIKNSYLEFSNKFKITFNFSFFWIHFALAILFNIVDILILIIVYKKDAITKIFRGVFETLSFIVTLLSIIFLLFGNLFIFGSVDGDSMLPTLKDNQRVVIYHYYPKIAKGDIAIIDANNSTIIKRIVATSDDQISFNIITEDNDNIIVKMFINGEIYKHYDGTVYEEITFTKGGFHDVISNLNGEGYLKKDYYFFIGDNFFDSSDSRHKGVYHYNDFLGKLIVPGNK